jgi:cyanophycinase
MMPLKEEVMLKSRLLVYIPILLAGLSVCVLPAAGVSTTDTLLIPIGGGYADTYTGFIMAAQERAPGDTIHILVLPTAYTSSAETISDDERRVNLDDAEKRRVQIETACEKNTAAKKCSVILLPIFTRADALAPESLAGFKPEVAAIFILGGDQTVLMQAIANTPIEQALSDAYARGTLIAGTSAGLSVQSVTMIGGYRGSYGPENGLVRGAVDLWNSDTRRGLPFGIKNAILEQHFWELSRLPRLLNAISQPDVPHVGLALDSYTGARIVNGTQFQGVFGTYTAAIFDAESYGAAAKARYTGDSKILSLRNVLIHLFAPGDFAYDLAARQSSLAPRPDKLKRTFDALKLPDGAGALLISGRLIESASLISTINTPVPTPLDPILARFIELSGGPGATILIVAAGFTSNDEAVASITAYKNALGSTVQARGLIISKTATGEIPPGASTAFGGLLFVGGSQALLDADLFGQVRASWASGKPLLVDDGAAAVAGAFFTAQAATPFATKDQAKIEAATQATFIEGNTRIAPGLGLLDVLIEPRIIADNRWGRLFALAYHHPDKLAFGLPDHTALEITRDGTKVLGANGVFALDLGRAKLALGTNNAYVVGNGLLDVFAPGDAAQPDNSG